MDITQFTSYSDVRAVLGVADDELEDATLALEVYASHLEMELDDIHPALIAKYFETEGVDEATRTETQAKFYKLTRLFAAYAVARQCVSGLPMFGPKDVSDGKAVVSRFADSPYKQVIDEVKTQYDRLLLALEKIFSELISVSATTTTRTYMAAIGQGIDRVTGS